MTPISASDLNHILDHTREIWEPMRGERLFLTGGTGFFGCWLLESFLWANEKLKLKAHAMVMTRRLQVFIDKAPHLALADSVTMLETDVRSFAFPAGTYSYVVHAATQPQNESGLDAIGQFHANTIGTQRTLEFARTCGAKKFLFTSSGSIYGKQPSQMTHIPETYAGAPDTIDTGTTYGQSKRISEYMCAIYAQNFGMDISIARCFAFVGPYLPLDSNYAIGNFIRDALNGGSVQINGDGTPYRSYLYAADLAIWLWTILFKGKSIYPYNVGSEHDLTIEQLASVVVKELAPQAKVQVAKEPVFQKPVSRYVPSTQRAKQDLKLETWVPLDEAIRRTADWYNPITH
jgi:nucleoside-diphosphate-sugar epimerase